MKQKGFVQFVCYSLLVLLVTTLVGTWAFAKPAREILKIGSTGNWADRQGIQLKKIFEMVADQLNQSGGLNVKGKKYNIQMVVYDDKYTADGGRAAFERLVTQDKVSFIVGSYGSAPCLAGLAVTEPNKIPIFGLGAAPAFVEPKYKYLTKTYYIVPGNASASTYFVKKKYDPTNSWKKAAIVEYDDTTGKAYGAFTKKALGDVGLQVTDLYVDRSATDVTPVAAKIKSINPDVVKIDAIQDSAGIFRLVKAIWESGWKGRLFAHYAQNALPNILKMIGSEATEGLVTLVTDPTALPTSPPTLLKFRQDYEKKYGVWEYDAIEWMGGWWCLMECIKRANSLDPDDLMAVRKGLEFDFPWGHAKLLPRPDINQPNYVDCAYPQYMGEVKKGKLVQTGVISPDDLIKAAETFLGTSLAPK